MQLYSCTKIKVEIQASSIFYWVKKVDVVWKTGMSTDFVSVSSVSIGRLHILIQWSKSVFGQLFSCRETPRETNTPTLWRTSQHHSRTYSYPTTECVLIDFTLTIQFSYIIQVLSRAFGLIQWSPRALTLPNLDFLNIAGLLFNSPILL